MIKKVVVDPLTRIEGHLRIEADIENGKIVDAYSTGTMVRGIEIIAQNRDPRDVWAYVGRVCGVCISMTSLVSVRAVENALGIIVRPNAELVRYLLIGALTIQDHFRDFEHFQALAEAVVWVEI